MFGLRGVQLVIHMTCVTIAARDVLRYNRRDAQAAPPSGLTLKSFGLIELNEALAAPALAVTFALGPDNADWVKPNGDAIALGHP